MDAPIGNVLIVEDDHDMREFLATVLTAKHFHAVTAEDGLEALHVLRTLRHGTPDLPCLVLLDLMMPRLSGQAFRRAQLEDVTVADVPVAVMSGAADLEERSLALGAVATIPKPIDIDNLVDTVRRHCARPRQFQPSLFMEGLEGSARADAETDRRR